MLFPAFATALSVRVRVSVRIVLAVQIEPQQDRIFVGV
jgi:hypothetical protein